MRQMLHYIPLPPFLDHRGSLKYFPIFYDENFQTFKKIEKILQGMSIYLLPRFCHYFTHCLISQLSLYICPSDPVRQVQDPTVGCQSRWALLTSFPAALPGVGNLGPCTYVSQGYLLSTGPELRCWCPGERVRGRTGPPLRGVPFWGG